MPLYNEEGCCPPCHNFGRADSPDCSGCSKKLKRSGEFTKAKPHLFTKVGMRSCESIQSLSFSHEQQLQEHQVIETGDEDIWDRTATVQHIFKNGLLGDNEEDNL